MGGNGERDRKGDGLGILIATRVPTSSKLMQLPLHLVAQSLIMPQLLRRANNANVSRNQICNIRHSL